MHILIPQLEFIIRYILGIAGLKVTSFVGRSTVATQLSSLNKLLESDEAERIFGSKVAWYLRIILIEKLGYNFRNKIAHGIINERECNQENSDLMIFLFILLTRYQKTT